MRIFDYVSYKAFVKDRIEKMPQQGRGQFRQMSERLRMHTSLISQIFGGDRHLTPEQACELCEYWGMTDLETEMFLALLNYEKAGSKKLKQVLEKQLETLRKKADKFSYRLSQEKQLSEETRSIFYSNWYYSGIRLLTSLSQYQNIDAIAEYFSLPKGLVSKVTQFLIQHGLCVLDKDENIQMGPQRTHLASDSTLVSRHHTNWRLKNLSRADAIRDHEIMFTAPLSISKKDAQKVRKKIFELVEDISATVKESKPEKLVCLNIDWMDI